MDCRNRGIQPFRARSSQRRAWAFAGAFFERASASLKPTSRAGGRRPFGLRRSLRGRRWGGGWADCFDLGSHCARLLGLERFERHHGCLNRGGRGLIAPVRGLGCVGSGRLGHWGICRQAGVQVAGQARAEPSRAHLLDCGESSERRPAESALEPREQRVLMHRVRGLAHHAVSVQGHADARDQREPDQETAKATAALDHGRTGVLRPEGRHWQPAARRGTVRTPVASKRMRAAPRTPARARRTVDEAEVARGARCQAERRTAAAEAEERSAVTAVFG